MHSNIINLIYIILASLLAVFGFYGNNIFALLGSMIVSPLLLPLLLNTFRKSGKTINAILITIWFGLMCIGIGILMSLINNYTEIFKTETEFMINRSILNKSLFIGEISVSIVCGLLLPFAFMYHDNILKVALSIAPSLLPALVNGGMYLGNYLYAKYNGLSVSDCLSKGVNSITISLSNITMIHVVFALCMYIINKYKLVKYKI